jgi:hypothetical protein
VENRQFRTRRLPPKLRYGLPICGDLVVEPLFEERILPLASPAFFKEHRPETSGRPPDSEQRQRRAVAGLVLEVHQLACAGAIPGTVRRGANVTRRGYAGFGLALESTTIGGLHLKASSSSIGKLHTLNAPDRQAPTTAPSQKPSFCMSNAIMAATNTKMLPTKMPLDVLAMT